MRVVVDARKYYDFGIGTYIQNLVEQLHAKLELVLLVAPGDAQKINRLSHIQKKINTSGKYSLRELRSIAADANGLHADVFHAPHYTVPFGLAMPCVTTIHDTSCQREEILFSSPASLCSCRNYYRAKRHPLSL